MNREFEVGDVCRVREWDDMAEEYGTDQYGDILANVGFIQDMKYLCGQRFTVSGKERHDYGFRYFSEENIESPTRKPQGLRYIVSGEMLELLEEAVPSDPIQAPGDFFSLFN